jgi:hypothetical protein
MQQRMKTTMKATTTKMATTTAKRKRGKSSDRT